MKKYASKQGYALATMVGIMTVMGLTFTVLLTMGKQQVFRGGILRDTTKAAAYAEAGIEFAYAVFRQDFENYKTPGLFRLNANDDYVAGSPLTSSYGDGDFTLSLTDVNNDGQYIIIRSVGTCNGASASAEVLVEDSYFEDNQGLDAFNNAISGGGSGKIGGGGSVGPQGTYHLDGDLAKNGGATINADLSAGGTITGNNTVNGNVNQGADIIGTPNIDFKDYYDVAKANEAQGTFLSGKIQLKHDWDIPGGVLYVDGEVFVKANIKGTIIATGDISFTDGGVSKSEFPIAAGTQTGNISYSSNGDSHGLFYSRYGDFSQTAGQGSITGQIIVGGNVYKTGGGALIFEVNIPDQVDTGANPVIAGWQE